MEYLRLLYELPATLAGTTIIAYLLPVKLEARVVPLLMFVVGLIVLRLPEFTDMALALTLAVALLQKALGITLTDHEPLKLRLPRLPKRVQIQEFATRAFLRPGDTRAEDGEPEDPSEEQADHEAPTVVTNVPKFVPSLLGK